MKTRDQGVVYLEMILALFPVLLVFMGITQLGLAHVARLVVRHSANVAARAAVVVLEDDPAHYGGTPRGSLEPGRRVSASRGSHGDLTGEAKRTSMGRGVLDAFFRVRRRVSRPPSRRGEIQWAAMFPLLAIAPDPRGLSTGFQQASVRGVLGDAATRLSGGLLYNLGATAITFPTTRGATAYRSRPYGPHEEVVVRVTHLFHCALPLVANLLCHHGRDLRIGRPVTSLPNASSQGPDTLRRFREKNQALDTLRPAMRELDEVPLPSVRDVLLGSGGHFLLLQAEAALPNQGAAYERQP